METQKPKRDFHKILSKYSLVLILIVFMAVCAIANKHFLKPDNLLNVARQQSVILIIAFGEMLLITAGLLDLAAGAVVALAGVLAVSAYHVTHSITATFAVAIGVSVACNLLSGFMVTKFRTPPFIATLAIQTMARGAALFYTDGQNIYDLGKFTVVGQGSFLGIPIPVIIMLVTFAVIFYLTNHTRMGRSIYAIGGNEQAANASGIKVKSVKMKTYAIHGVLVGIAAAVFVSRVNGAMPNGAQGYEFDAMTATIIGGTSFSGGVGSAFGTMIGAFIVGFLSNIMNLISVNSYIQQIVKGVIIAGAVIWDLYSKEKKTYKKGSRG